MKRSISCIKSGERLRLNVLRINELVLVQKSCKQKKTLLKKVPLFIAKKSQRRQISCWQTTKFCRSSSKDASRCMVSSQRHWRTSSRPDYFKSNQLRSRLLRFALSKNKHFLGGLMLLAEKRLHACSAISLQLARSDQPLLLFESRFLSLHQHCSHLLFLHFLFFFQICVPPHQLSFPHLQHISFHLLQRILLLLPLLFLLTHFFIFRLFFGFAFAKAFALIRLANSLSLPPVLVIRIFNIASFPLSVLTQENTLIHFFSFEILILHKVFSKLVSIVVICNLLVDHKTFKIAILVLRISIVTLFNNVVVLLVVGPFIRFEFQKLFFLKRFFLLFLLLSLQFARMDLFATSNYV